MNSSVSSAAQNTPLRAIPSTLVLRAAQPVPPASETYEPLVKSLLRRRLVHNILLPSLIATWSIVNIWSTWEQGGIFHFGLWGTFKNAFHPLILVFTLATFVVGVLPSIVLRNRFMAVSPTHAPSPSKMLKSALAKRSTQAGLIIYIASSLLLAGIHAAMARTLGSTDLRLSLFVNSKKHPYYLNGHTIYFISSQTALACAYLVRSVLQDRFSLRWTSMLTPPDAPRGAAHRLGHFLLTIITMGFFVALCGTLHTVAFGLARSIAIPIIFKIPLVRNALKPFIAHFRRGSFTLTLLLRNLSFIIRTSFLGLTSALCWELAESPLSENVSVAHKSADPMTTLISGIKSTDAYFKHYAYTELRRLACEDGPTASTHRSSLFSDQKYNPNQWSTLVRESLLTLGKDYQLLLRRGEPEAPPPAPAPAPAPPKPLPAPATPLIRKPIMRDSTQSPFHAAFEAFASDGPIVSAVETTANAAASPVSGLVQSAVQAAPPSDIAANLAKKGSEHAYNLVIGSHGRLRETVDSLVAGWEKGRDKKWAEVLPQWANVVRSQIEAWWTRDRLGRMAEAALPNRYLDALAISVLCHFVCASLEEDKYGVVQRDIPKILEALLSFLAAVEDYRNELNDKQPRLSAEELEKLSWEQMAERARVEIEVFAAKDVLSVVHDPLTAGIANIVRTFGERLSAFKFPQTVAHQLQRFVEYA
ncbi:hypothetical protein WOLCODRAFT_140745 [Wolfiporia cocos MD-104 SS10]|uniref:Nucleoporin protein Ndc1-Nup n=1 Tax=Wolfiporia cocos (strain MD-104) TaxID=742152 RepID=A0A2H3J4N2_WOLCO|nr:hypothetical protein WOLCODRAFT_140745 [Wolfiporia cocos MD-104 SS10]